jgi:hypothetical protein
MFNPMMGPGPYEKQTPESEAKRKNKLTLDRAIIYTLILILWVCEALLFGELFGPLCLVAFVVLALDIDAQKSTITVRHCPLYTMLFIAGAAFTLLPMTSLWLLHIENDGSALWISHPWGGGSIPIAWQWLRYALLILFPVFIWLLMPLDLRTKLEIIAPNWANSFRARPPEVKPDNVIAQELGVVYPHQGVENETEPRDPAPNAPVY